MTTLADLMAEPDHVDFHSVRADFIRLEKTMNAKAYVDASFAWLVERSDAGRLVGSSRPIDFLIKALGLSWQEAVDRVGRGEGLFTTPVVPPMPTPEPEAGESAEDAAARERLLRQEEARRREQDEKAQREARDQARKVAAEKQKIIRQELRTLNEHSSPSRAVLQAEALEGGRAPLPGGSAGLAAPSGGQRQCRRTPTRREKGPAGRAQETRPASG
ncbi:hypothetical protein QP028_02785 [Corynebacterium suedekumii]|nr:hypothetical protein QP028_02785 [Corynebacterium suedekumii]